MLFIEWGLIGRFCLCLALIAAAIVAFRLPRERYPRLQQALRSLSWPLTVFAVLFLALNLLAAGCQTWTAPLYSPDGKMAVRVRAADEGWLGEWTAVELFSAHGLRKAVIFHGPWDSVNAGDLRWKNNSKLEIYYQENVFYCGHAFGVSVHCIAK